MEAVAKIVNILIIIIVISSTHRDTDNATNTSAPAEYQWAVLWLGSALACCVTLSPVSLPLTGRKGRCYNIEQPEIKQKLYKTEPEKF